MRVKPEGASRRLIVDTAYLAVDALFHPDGRVEVSSCEVRDPRAPGTDQVLLAELRARACETCEHNDGVKREVNGLAVYLTKCRLCPTCGGGGISLLHGQCQDKRWPLGLTIDAGSTGD